MRTKENTNKNWSKETPTLYESKNFKRQILCLSLEQDDNYSIILSRISLPSSSFYWSLQKWEGAHYCPTGSTHYKFHKPMSPKRWLKWKINTEEYVTIKSKRKKKWYLQCFEPESVDYLLNLLLLFFGFPHSPNKENRPAFRSPIGVPLTCEL